MRTHPSECSCNKCTTQAFLNGCVGVYGKLFAVEDQAGDYMKMLISSLQMIAWLQLSARQQLDTEKSSLDLGETYIVCGGNKFPFPGGLCQEQKNLFLNEVNKKLHSGVAFICVEE